MMKLYWNAARWAMAVVVTLVAAVSVSAGNGPRFMENRGQFPASVKYQLRVANADVFFEKDRLLFNFIDPELIAHDHEAHAGHQHHRRAAEANAHAYQVVFERASAAAEVVGEQAYGDVTNYFSGNDPSNWASGVKAFEQLWYRGIYPGIDLHYYGHEGTLKYDLILDPNTDASLIALRYDGVSGISLKNGQLHVSNTFNEVVEMRPVAFQIINGKRVEVRCEFTMNGHTVGFTFPDGYDRSEELVIDPVLIFSSYSGSVSNNFGFTATYDTDGALYGGGTTYGATYPTVVGSYSNPFGGQVDMAITKFAADGASLVWSTFIGGSSAEAPNSMVVNSLGQLVVLGSTSSPNFPTTANAFDQTYNGGVPINYPSNGTDYTNGSDIVVFVFNANGSALLGSTFLGGSGNDGLNQSGALAYNYGDNFRGEVIVDGNNDIYITSSTLSADLPVTSGVFDATLSGTQDAVVAKFSPDVSSLIWCGYMGGSAEDAGYSVKLASTGSLYITGGTVSPDFSTTSGALNPNALGGSADGFVARISNDASSIERATYIGTNAYDQTYFVEVDADDNVYLYGQSLGTIPVTSGAYSNNNGRQFIQELNSDLTTLQLSTRFGSGGSAVNISPTAFLVDVCNRIYVSGWGGGTNNFWNGATGNTSNMPITSNAFQSTTDGSDFYFMVLEGDAASLLYATYFGGVNTQEHVDGGTSRFNSAGVIHQAVCAGCGGSSAFPTTPGAWSTTNNAPGGCNLGVIKLDMEITGVDVNIDGFDFVANPLGCAPVDLQFQSTVSDNAQFTWYFGDGATSLLQNPTHTYAAPGTYQVLLIGVDTLSCAGVPLADTAIAVITVNGILDPADAGADAEVCGTQPVVIGTPAISGYAYSWSPAAGLNNPNSAQPTATPSQTQSYTLTVTDAAGCQDQDVMQVDVFNVTLSNSVTVCGGQSVQLNASAPAGATFSWSPAAQLDNPNISNPTATVTETTAFTVTVDNGQSCIVSRQVTVQLAPQPLANAGPDQGVCPGGSVTLNASGGVQYQWSPTTYLSNPNVANPTVIPLSDITYSVTVTNANGCTATDVVNVAYNPLPIVTASPNVQVCADAQVQLQASGALTYVWSPTVGLDDPLSVSPVATVPQTVTYTVTGTDANGCVNTAQVTVDVFSVNLSGQSAVCPGGTVQLGVDGGVSWAWSPANLVSNPTVQNPSATVNVPTLFTVAVSNGQGCIVVGQLNVDVFPPALANAGNDLVACDGAPVVLNGSGGVVYQWSPATYLSSATVPDPVATPEQDISYTLTVTDANGCTATDVMNVSVLPSPSASVSPDVEICIGQSTQLTASGGVTYSWSPIIAMDDPNSATPTVAPFQPTTYTVTVTDANGCSDSESVTVSIFTVAAFASPDGTVCLGDSLLLAATNGTTFSWAPQTGLSNPGNQSTYALPSENITYVVTATSATGCDATDSVEVAVVQNPVASFTADFVPTCEGVRGRFTNTSTGANRYRWNFSVPPGASLDTDIEIYFANGQGPTVTLYSVLQGSGCRDSIIQDFSGQFFSNDSVDVFWPNVITPNNDGLNDCFRPGFIGEFSDCYELIVYNRWGALIFESIGTGNCWDGRTKAGALMPEGTYYFISRVLDQEKAGWVQLIRD